MTYKLHYTDFRYPIRKAIALYISENSPLINDGCEIVIRKLGGDIYSIRVYDRAEGRELVFESQFDIESEEINAIYRMIKIHE